MLARPSIVGWGGEHHLSIPLALDAYDVSISSPGQADLRVGNPRQAQAETLS